MSNDSEAVMAERARCLAIVRAHAQFGGDGGYDLIELDIESGVVPPESVSSSVGDPEPWVVEYERRHGEVGK